LTIPQDKTPRLLKPLSIFDRPWQHVSIDFYKLLKDCNGYDTVFVNVDCLGKHVISIPCKKTITAEKAAKLYITYIYQIYRLPDTIVSDQGLQFMLNKWVPEASTLSVSPKTSTKTAAYCLGSNRLLISYSLFSVQISGPDRLVRRFRY
jgi:hypothetical protein